MKLPITPFRNIGISLSGGGYRAASFHLGALTYLYDTEWEEKRMIEHIRAISTVSGGTFTGAKYAVEVAKGNALPKVFHDLRYLMAKVDLPGSGLKKLANPKDWGSSKSRSLINAMSMVYHEELVSENLGVLWEENSHLKEIIFNASEFKYGLPFRFQRSQEFIRDGREMTGLVGNLQVNVDNKTAKECHISDIIAASSCFPGGFEPINFPHDFRYPGSTLLDKCKQSAGPDSWGTRYVFPLGLMDGGILDNQGIGSILWAEKRMSEYTGDLQKYRSDDVKALDLFVISDVSALFMDGYTYAKEKPLKGWRKWSFKTFNIVGIVFLLAIAGSITGACFTPTWASIVLGILAGFMLIGAGISFVLGGIFDSVLKFFNVPYFFRSKLKHFSKIPFGVFETLVVNRVSSMTELVADVFMKQIRRLSYNQVYHDTGWKPRVVMNSIYELGKVQVETRARKKPHLSEPLRNPGEKIMDATQRAESMGTTLWFTKADLTVFPGERENLLDTLIACGQFTMCFNLLEYIEETLWGDDKKYFTSQYSPELQAETQALYDCMMADWKRFQIDPFWKVKEWNEQIKEMRF